MYPYNCSEGQNNPIITSIVFYYRNNINKVFCLKIVCVSHTLNIIGNSVDHFW